jgi:hypothetical protein
MMKKLIYILIITVSIFSISILSIDAVADTSGYEGYAIYRDGVAFGIEWHAGLMNQPSSTYENNTIIHTDGHNTKYGTWLDFVGSNGFKGVYKPKAGLSNVERGYALTTGRALASENIPYNVRYQLNYSSDLYGKWVRTYEITSMRCDGLVEYAYEWNDIRVYGSIENNLWNISWGDEEIWKHHSYFNITPKSQASNYMTLILSSRPMGSYK